MNWHFERKECSKSEGKFRSSHRREILTEEKTITLMPTALCLQRIELRCLKIGNLKEEKNFKRRQFRNFDGGTVTENQGNENFVLVKALFIQSTLQATQTII